MLPYGFTHDQLRCIQDLPITIHLDFVTSKKTALRFTLSSLFQSLRSAGTVLRIPLRYDRARMCRKVA